MGELVAFKPKKKKLEGTIEGALREDLRIAFDYITKKFKRRDYMFENQVEKLQNRAYSTGYNEGYEDGYRVGADDVAKGWIKNK